MSQSSQGVPKSGCELCVYEGEGSIKNVGRATVEAGNAGEFGDGPGSENDVNAVAQAYKPDPEDPYPPNLGGGDSHPNLGRESSKNTCFTVFSGAPSLNLGGEIFTPQIWGVWVLRGGH